MPRCLPLGSGSYSESFLLAEYRGIKNVVAKTFTNASSDVEDELRSEQLVWEIVKLHQCLADRTSLFQDNLAFYEGNKAAPLPLTCGEKPARLVYGLYYAGAGATDLLQFFERHRGDAKVVNPAAMLENLAAIAMILNYMHDNGVCHNDLKLENVFVVPPADANRMFMYLGDFGFATKTTKVRAGNRRHYWLDEKKAERIYKRFGDDVPILVLTTRSGERALVLENGDHRDRYAFATMLRLLHGATNWQQLEDVADHVIDNLNVPIPQITTNARTSGGGPPCPRRPTLDIDWDKLQSQLHETSRPSLPRTDSDALTPGPGERLVRYRSSGGVAAPSRLGRRGRGRGRRRGGDRGAGAPVRRLTAVLGVSIRRSSSAASWSTPMPTLTIVFSS